MANEVAPVSQRQARLGGLSFFFLAVAVVGPFLSSLAAVILRASPRLAGLDPVLEEIRLQIGDIEHNAATDLVVGQPTLPDQRPDHESRHAQDRRGLVDREAPPRRGRPASGLVVVASDVVHRAESLTRSGNT